MPGQDAWNCSEAEVECKLYGQHGATAPGMWGIKRYYTFPTPLKGGGEKGIRAVELLKRNIKAAYGIVPSGVYNDAANKGWIVN